MMDVEDEYNHMCAAFRLRYRFVNQQLLLQNEYLAAENYIWKAGLQPGLAAFLTLVIMKFA